MPPEILNEEALRREDFAEGTRVVLADGQPWSLRVPLVWFVPHDDSPSGWRSVLTLAPDDDYQDLLDARSATFAGEDRAEVGKLAGAELAIARRLLEANYDLTTAQVARLLRFSYDRDENPEGWRIRDQVIDVALGIGPKRSPDGIEVSPTPSGGLPGETG